MQNAFSQLAAWSAAAHAELPWRRNRSLYGTLVSEIMLQQTTVASVAPRFDDFLRRFPDFAALGAADDEALRQAWAGLGYYRRAQHLRQAAAAFAQVRDIPSDTEALRLLPGIGPYTAAALRAIGLNLPALAVDGNLQRVLSRLFHLRQPQGPELSRRLEAMAEQAPLQELITGIGPRAFNEALMDLGREICRPRQPRCLICPLKNHCAAALAGDAESLPAKDPKAPKAPATPITLLRLLVRDPLGRLLAYRKNPGEWLNGQWELPTLIIGPIPDKFKQYPAAPEQVPAPKGKALLTSITRYRLANHLLPCQEILAHELAPWLKSRELTWLPWPDPESPLSTSCLKLLAQMPE